MKRSLFLVFAVSIMAASLFGACQGGVRDGNSSSSKEPKNLYTFDTIGPANVVFHLETQPVDSGFGYVIAINGKKFIDQPLIPVVEGVHPFRTEQDAFNIGKLAVLKLLCSTDLPSITIEELIEYGVVGPDGKL